MIFKSKRLFETNSVKYLGIKIDKRSVWKQQINHVALKLKKANVILSKLRDVLDITLTSVSYVKRESYIWYTSLVWVQNSDSV